jgi:FAD/FMN-containing dehydrogenase
MRSTQHLSHISRSVSPPARQLQLLTSFQAGIRFAQAHDLRVVIKSSGHDYLGRSTAKNSLLLWTAYFQNITFTEQFFVAGEDHGPAVTLGSGVGLKTMYAAAQARGKMVVGGTAATVSPAGGYIQGAGHSAFSPLYGLAADNVIRMLLGFPFSSTGLKMSQSLVSFWPTGRL